MDELINLVAEKAGLPKDKAKIAVETVVGFLDDKLPISILNDEGELALGGDSAKKIKGLAEGLGGSLFKK